MGELYAIVAPNTAREERSSEVLDGMAGPATTDPSNFLPDDALRRNLVFCERFLALGLTTFREAVRYVHQLPYGPNRQPFADDSLFRDGCGTCTTKHGAIALLAQELDLPVYRWSGIYRLNEDIVEGTGAILQRYNIPFVPSVHCFLVYEERMIDLTFGNNNGKKKAIDGFLTIWADSPGQSRIANQVRSAEFVDALLAVDPAFSHISHEELREAQAQCMICVRKNREAIQHPLLDRK